MVDPETCGCICPPDDPCPAGLKMNQDRCRCECSGPVVCSAPKVQDPEACACICPPEEACPAHLTKDPETCQCVCPPGTGLCKDECVAPCLPTEAYNDDCKCEPIVCPPDRVLTCTCACPQGMAECDGNCLPACGPNQVFDGACRCVCRPNISCAEGWKLDPATCECVCGLTTCPAGKELDKQACQCICPRNQSCLTGQTPNPDTCICECGPEPCPPGKIKNKACRCECPRNIACRQGETLDPATCKCRCAPGSVIETIRVPCRGGIVSSTTALQAGVTYTMRASGTCRLGANNTGDAEYAYQTINPANPIYLQDKCVGNGKELGIGINDPVVDGTKTPYWGAYTTTHVYTTTFTGNGQTIDLNYHDCFYNDNEGEITIEILCPGTPTSTPVGTGTATPICTNTCPTGKTLDPQTCTCVCPAAECAAPFQRDPTTCGCVCPPNISCQKGESVDPKTCKCRCNPGATMETVTVPCSGAATLSTTSLQAGVTYVLRASGTCTIGYVLPPTPDTDAEYAFNPANPSIPGWDSCPGSTNLGIGIDDAILDGTKTPNWGAYSPTHVYTIGFVGKGAPISVNYHDCVLRDNVGTLQVDIICPGAAVGDPVDSGEEGTSNG